MITPTLLKKKQKKDRLSDGKAEADGLFDVLYGWRDLKRNYRTDENRTLADAKKKLEKTAENGTVADALKNRTFTDALKNRMKNAKKNGIASSSIVDGLKRYVENGEKDGKDDGNGTVKRGLSMSSIADGLKRYENLMTAGIDVEGRIRNAVIRKGLVGSSIEDGVDAASGEISRYMLEKIERRLTGQKSAADGDAISPEAIEKTVDAGKNPTESGENIRRIEKKIQTGNKDGKFLRSIDTDGGENADGNGADRENKYVETERNKKIKRKNTVEEKYRGAYEFYSEMDKNTARRLIDGDIYIKNYLGKEYYERLRGAFKEG
jgi:hypothetical protein